MGSAHRVPNRRARHLSRRSSASAFTFVVNGVPIFARGVNWIPDDVFPSRITADRYRERLQQAKAANVDLIRVWGGGIYEDDAFYEECDELGLMVWQDFLFACAAYPEHLLADEVEAEARDNVTRLMPHPSLVLWNGNNENIWGYFDWGWHERLQGRTWGAGFYFDLLPRVCAELDPARPVLAGQPVLRLDGGRAQRRRARLRPPVGRLEPARLHPLSRSCAPVRRPSSDGRLRRRGRRCVRRSAMPFSRPTRRAWPTIRRRPTATSSCVAGSRPTSECPTTSTHGGSAHS